MHVAVFEDFSTEINLQPSLKEVACYGLIERPLGNGQEKNLSQCEWRGNRITTHPIFN